MTTRLEWITSAAARCWYHPPGEPAPDGQVAEHAGAGVLIIGHGDSGGVAIEGTRDELVAMLDRARAAVSAGEGMVIEYLGEAYESFQNAVDAMQGYGVTIVRADGSSVEAVLMGSDHDAEDGATVLYLPDAGRFDYDVSQAPPGTEVVSEVVARIVVT